MKKIVFATGSRADYGIVRKFLTMLNEDVGIELKIVATGALLSDEFGHQVDLIYEDGFLVDKEIELPLKIATNQGVIHAMSVALDEFGNYFGENRVDLLIILGDRYEMLSVAIAAAMQQVPILHIHGGEATYANYDEFIRHCITKMSTYHFTATEEYRKRVIQLGENPKKVFNVGALGAENCLHIDKSNVPQFLKEVLKERYFVVLFHPETLIKVNVVDQVKIILDTLLEFQEYQYIFIGSNADTHSNQIRDFIQSFVKENDNAEYFENLHPNAYHYLLKKAVCLIGNSSSGIIEAPTLGTYTINIGNRQAGRVRGNSIIDVPFNVEKIKAAIRQVLEKKSNDFKIENPYYKKNTSVHYYKITKQLLSNLEEDKKNVKQFYDLCRDQII